MIVMVTSGEIHGKDTVDMDYKGTDMRDKAFD